MDLALLAQAYRDMLRIRRAEEVIAEDFKARKIFSFLHLSIGQEAVAVGTCMALKPEDRVWGNHRSHAHYLAKGGDLFAMFAEVYGKAGGCCRGKGGSMHMLDRSVGFMGSTPILGAVIPIALGSAFEQKVSKSPFVSVCFFGDGASEEGVFYESVNMAAVKKLPVIFVIENNGWSVNTPPDDRRHPRFSYHDVVEGLGASYCYANALQVEQVYKTMLFARDEAVAGRPVVMEAKTIRNMAHSGPITDESCRTWDTAAYRFDNDCLNKTLLVMTQGQPMTAEDGRKVEVFVTMEWLEKMRQEVEEEVTTAHKLAIQSPDPEVSEMDKGAYA